MDFHETLKDDVFDLFYSEWLDADIFDEEEFDDIYDIMNELSESFFQLYFPARSQSLAIAPVLTASSSALVLIAPVLVQQKIESLSALPQPAQKTIEWYQYRHDLMTASNIWKVFASDAQRNSLIYEKCKPFTSESRPNNWHATGSLQWGVLYEPISILLYETIYKTKIQDFGCIKHPSYACIGASPDGINVDPSSDRYGRMLEVKNIVNREITGIPKEEYWIQMQLQMETCDLDDCDFLETRFKEYASEDDFHKDTCREWKGAILCFIQRDLINSKPTYKYTPLDRKYDFAQWVAEMKDAVKNDGLILFSTAYWYLDQLSCVYVQRNKAWFGAALPKILDTWKTIVGERETGYEHRAATKRNTDIFISTSDGTHLIHNLKIPTNVCLVKLDCD
jgi:putative phage-type endonuclease